MTRIRPVQLTTRTKASALYGAIALMVFSATAAAAAPGELDSSFGTGGKVAYQLGVGQSPESGAYGLGLGPDGQVAIAGVANWNDLGDGAFDVTRHTSDGAFDPSFNGDGVFAGQFGLSARVTSQARGIVVQPDGKIVVVGSASAADGNSELVVARFTSDGSLDRSFAGGGLFRLHGGTAGGAVSFGTGIALEGDKILVTGGSADASGYDQLIVLRLTSAGTLDPSFASGHPFVAQVSSVADNGSHGTAVEPADGGVVAVGEAYQTADRRTAFVVRLHNDGTPDHAFGTDGIARLQLGTGAVPESAAIGLGALPDGKLIVGASATDPGGEAVAAARITAAGELDTSYGDGGIAARSLGDLGFLPEMGGFALQPNGRAVMSAQPLTGGSPTVAVLRFSASGQVDMSFGSGGLAKAQLGSGSTPVSLATALALTPDGKIVVVGSATDALQHPGFLVARWIADTPPTAAFSSSASAIAGSAVAFDGSDSTDPDGSVTAMRWDFGDGTSGEGTTVSHTFAAPGTYTVKLTVTDDYPLTASLSKTVVVKTRLARFGGAKVAATGTSRGGHVTLRVRCPASAVSVCKGSIKLTAIAGRRPATYARMRFTIPSRRRMTLTGTLTHTATSKLADLRVWRARATTNSIDGSGRRATSARTVKVRRVH